MNFPFLQTVAHHAVLAGLLVEARARELCDGGLETNHRGRLVPRRLQERFPRTNLLVVDVGAVDPFNVLVSIFNI